MNMLKYMKKKKLIDDLKNQRMYYVFQKLYSHRRTCPSYKYQNDLSPADRGLTHKP